MAVAAPALPSAPTISNDRKHLYIALLTHLSSMADNNDRTNNQGDTSNRGFASMDEDKQREIASKGGQSQGKENNPGNFANDRQKASEAGRKGGQNSHGGNQNDQ